MKEEKRETPSVLFVRSYSNAFKFHLFGAAAIDLLVDSVFLFVSSFIVVYWLGQLPLINDLYRWTWQAGWWFIQYLVIPAVFTIVVLVRNRRSKEGLSVLRWIYVRLLFRKRKYTPFCEEPTVWRKIWNWVRREEELY